VVTAVSWPWPGSRTSLARRIKKVAASLPSSTALIPPNSSTGGSHGIPELARVDVP
jgi:hypothetical protein